MKILLTGGGTGGHFYPIIAIADALYNIAEEERLVGLELILMSDNPYDKTLLQRKGIHFQKITSGKMRRYFSLLNITDGVKTLIGILSAIRQIYAHFPDVIFGKGGYASFPALVAARIFKIPVIIHESDVVPGKVNKWAGSFAKRVAISFPDSLKYFPREKTALTGNPIRTSILGKTPDEAREVFQLESSIPTILVLGGSQGSQKINDIFLDIAPELVKNYQVIHQCGRNNIDSVTKRMSVVLEKSSFKNRYHIFGFLNDTELRNASSAADIAISRAGSGAIFEIAAWNLPSILIPLPNSAQDHQRENAYAYARTGACQVIEQENLTPHILLSEIQKLLKDEKRKTRMRDAAAGFAKLDAAQKIAREIICLLYISPSPRDLSTPRMPSSA